MEPSELTRLVRAYYKSHSPIYGDPKDYNNINKPCPPIPCECELCVKVRAAGILKTDRSGQRLWIMQGVPGSGKSTIAYSIAMEHAGIICSTDTFFMTENGLYQFDATKLVANHQKNTRRAIALMDEGWNVIVDNTNVQRWACRDYVRHAVKLGIPVEFVRATGRFTNAHAVPEHVVESMRASMEDLSVDSVLSSETPWEIAAKKKAQEEAAASASAAVQAAIATGVDKATSPRSPSPPKGGESEVVVEGESKV